MELFKKGKWNSSSSAKAGFPPYARLGGHIVGQELKVERLYFTLKQ